MCEALAPLAVGDRVLRLGYSGIGDYARERLGIAGRTAQAMVRLARELRDRPLLRELVRRGEVSARKAQAVLPVARGDDELQWVERARTETVRALEADVRAAKTVGDPEDDEDWERICVPLAPEGRAKLDEAMELAGKLLGATAPKWQRLVGMRTLGLWRELHFASFAHYCTERLGMAPRTVEQRVWLERRFYELPELRQAMRTGRLSYEKARLVAGCANDSTVNGWIEKAEKTTCISLKREIESRDEAQMCALGELDLRVPRRVAVLLEEVFRAARKTEGRWRSPGACLERVAQHFIEVWNEVLRERSTPQRRVLVRDHGYCQVPGCSRAAAHAHHVLYRSLGGGDEGENLVGLCAAHHLHCVHRGWVRVRGRAPDRLVWELGVRPGREPLVAVPLVVLCIPNSLE